MNMSFFKEKNKILVTCSKGVAPFLKTELEHLGYPIREEKSLGVFTEGNFADCYNLNLQLRTGLRVLYLVKEFQARSVDELYKELFAIRWEDYLYSDGYVSVTSAVLTDAINNTQFANLKCKDAIVDRMTQKTGRRPDSGPDRNKAVVFLYWKDDEAAIYLDTSGEPLSKRGYRKIPLKAPMQEALAAAVVLATDWKDDGRFINPMCGSGTIAIEAALSGLNMAPGLLRNNFGFMHLQGYEREEYQTLRKSLRDRRKNSLSHRIIATDWDAQAVAAAQKNARTAGVEQFLEFKVCDFSETLVPPEKGVIVLNPPYGMRMSEVKALEEQYKEIGDFFKQKCSGYRGFIFTGNLALLKKVGLKSKRRLLFFTGKLEARLVEYELYAGSRKSRGEKDVFEH